MLAPAAEGYDGVAPIPDAERPATSAGQVPVAVAAAIAGVPFAAWVATHRHHHAFTDRPGDPHSPYRYGTSLRGLLRGLLHAHLGWMFRDDPTPVGRYAPDLQADRFQTDLSAAVIKILERAGWARNVRWPTPSRLDGRRRPGGDREDPVPGPAGL